MRTTAFTPSHANRHEVERARARFVERPFEDFEVRELMAAHRVIFTERETGQQFSKVGRDDDVEFFTIDSGGKVHYLRERGKPRPILTSTLLSTVSMPRGGRTDGRPWVPVREDPPSLEQRIAALEKGSA